MDVEDRLSKSMAREEVYVPSALARPVRIAPESRCLLVDSSELPLEGRNILTRAANGQHLLNCDPLLYTPENSANWAAVAETSHDNKDEIDTITRASVSHAVWVQPPEILGLWSIGGATAFKTKERVVIEEHISEGRDHQFKVWAYSDVNPDSLAQTVEDGKKLAEELGLDDIEHIPLLGDVYDPFVQKRNKEILGNYGLKFLTTVFGYTLQNLSKRVNGYGGATEELEASLKSLKKTMPKGSTLFATFGHEADKKTALAPYITSQGEQFVRGGASEYLGDEIMQRVTYAPRFVRSTTVLERPLKLTEQIVVDFGKDGTAILPKGTDVWMGISAKQPPNYVREAFDSARFTQFYPKPFFNREGNMTCQVACNM